MYCKACSDVYLGFIPPPQDVVKVCTESSAIRNVTVPITDAAIAHTGRVCVTRGCTGASVTCVSIRAASSPQIVNPGSTQDGVTCPTAAVFHNFGFVSLSLACPKWVFGPGCSEECKCVRENTLECHRRHGTCACKPGYQGDECEKGPNRTKGYKRFKTHGGVALCCGFAVMLLVYNVKHLCGSCV